jgi:hypothetical protein
VLVVLWSRRLHAAVSDVGRESTGARTLSGSLRKAVAIGRPLHAVSTGIAKARVVQGSGTYFLSFAVFSPFRNCRPLAVVVSTVSALALDSPCTHAIHCQRTRPWSGGRAPSPSAPSAGGVMLRAPWRGRRAVKGLLVNPVVALQEPARLPHRIASRPTSTCASLNHHRRCLNTTGAARTGTFWRFAGRPSPSPIAALAALRLAALSIFSVFVVA